jgi:hypothetical protein
LKSPVEIGIGLNSALLSVMIAKASTGMAQTADKLREPGVFEFHAS